MRLNRTFMELKHDNSTYAELYDASLNRTFMELKPAATPHNAAFGRS